MTLTRGFIRNAVTTPLDVRLHDMALVTGNSDGSPRTGVLGHANASIVTTAATMDVNVAAAEFVTSKGKADGVAVFTNDGTVAVPITAAPVSNSRITVIWVKHNDDTTGDATSTPVFGTTDGVAEASPVKPAIPTGALELATIRVYSGTTATNGGSNTLTNTYQMTAARGGVVGFRAKADMTAWANPTPGQPAYVTVNSELYEWTGAAWTLILRPWASYVPTFTNFTLGNGTLSAKWQQAGSVVTGFIRLTLGTTSALTGTMTISLPVAPVDLSTRHHGGGSWIRAALPGTPYPVQARIAGAASVIPVLFNSSAAVVTTTSLSDTYPGPPASGDALHLPFSYEAAG